MQQEDLIRLFAELTDDALLERIHSGDLTDAAEEFAHAEARRRGLDMSRDAPANIQKVALPPPDYVQLSGYLKPIEAYVLQGRLNAEGIDAQLSGANTVETNPLWFNALGGVRLFVPKLQLARASEILAMQDKGAYDLAEEGDQDGVDVNTGKYWLGWTVLVIPTLIFGFLAVFQIWKSACAPNTYCAIQEQQGETVASYLMKCFATALAFTPVAFSIRYLELRFKKPSPSRR
ncbi:hypothetical protein ACFFJT_02140 [Dyella flava]|uniref:Signal transducing protein n=1 Tax=Dyella flava TaxID=1920170 RepID=A0ABS2K569_9GAMM|nr:hypothetical protein [Dyella flava]MBM7126200.1 hypothetical protein [Dyella flava]GLQ48994.1 hypothetical protein GCM10010872_04430 [Dyella flava]